MLLIVIGAFCAVWPEARARLSANANTIANFNATLGFRADSDRLANNLVTDAAWVVGLAPAGSKSVKLRSAHTTVCDLWDWGQYERSPKV